MGKRMVSWFYENPDYFFAIVAIWIAVLASFAAWQWVRRRARRDEAKARSNARSIGEAMCQYDRP